MQFTNNQGTPVDPVPFLVAVFIGFLLLYSFGPGYLMTFGLDIGGALAAVTGAFVCVVAAAFHQFVWTARPEHRTEIPSTVRLKRLFYAVFIAIAVFVLLLIPVHA